MLSATRDLQSALEALISSMPGQRDVDTAISTVQKDFSKVYSTVLSPQLFWMNFFSAVPKFNCWNLVIINTSIFDLFYVPIGLVCSLGNKVRVRASLCQQGKRPLASILHIHQGNNTVDCRFFKGACVRACVCVCVCVRVCVRVCVCAFIHLFSHLSLLGYTSRYCRGITRCCGCTR